MLARECDFFEAFEEHRDSDRTCSGALVTDILTEVIDFMKKKEELYSFPQQEHSAVVETDIKMVPIAQLSFVQIPWQSIFRRIIRRSKRRI